MDTISNIDMDTQEITTADLHELKMKIKEIERFCKDKQIPFFLTYYTPKHGYSYSGLFPEEINSNHVVSEHWRFLEFLKVVVGFNREDYKPIIKKNKTQ